MSELKDYIIFEDEYFAILYKKAGEDSQIFFREFFSDKKYCEVVNRLDKPVSGLLIVAFSPKIHENFNTLFSSNKIKKEYWAICKKTENAKINELVKCEDLISFNTKTQKSYVYNESGKIPKTNFKLAKLFFCIAGFGENYNFVRVFPLTGRTHQIRVQLANYGMPIKGDIKYRSKRSEKAGGIRLHAYSLEFPYPFKKKKQKKCKQMKFTCPPKKADALWEACIDTCLNYENNNTQNGS